MPLTFSYKKLHSTTVDNMRILMIKNPMREKKIQIMNVIRNKDLQINLKLRNKIKIEMNMRLNEAGLV